ncbi:hypothetical protein ACH5RR_041670 [Cinchona calisaya]|uniref:Dirigent protein n=1 Tax=Cinchona calisaya TaxID=153742 RepID=A0ABD2XVF2_9GENT
MAVKTFISVLFLCSILSSTSFLSHSYNYYPQIKPCKELVFYFHDILYKGNNRNNATAVIVGAPEWGNKTAVAEPFNFEDLVVFNDPITLDNNLHSPPVGRAQGMYVYDQQNTYSAWFSFSFVFNSTEHKGSLNFVGANPLLNKTTDISVIGGLVIFSWLEGFPL